MSMATLASLREDVNPVPQPVSMSMDTVGGFENMQRAAKLFSSSSIVPRQYQGNIANCFVAVDMALRMGANPLLVMQNLYIVQGNPAWSAQFLIATFNKCGRFTSLRYEFSGREGSDDWGCRAIATELSTGEKLTGPLITVDMAKKNGWYGKPGSKWQTMPEMMLRYRAAAWFVRAYAPEIAMGLQTAEEARDSVIDITPEKAGPVLEDFRPEREEKPARRPRHKPEKEPAPVEADEIVIEQQTQEPAKPEPVPEQPDDEVRIRCPKPGKDGAERMVTSEDCWYCGDRDDCPAYSQNL